MLQHDFQNSGKDSCYVKKTEQGNHGTPSGSLTKMDYTGNFQPLSFNLHTFKYPSKEALWISWNNSRALLDRARFRKWEYHVTPRGKLCNANVQFLISVSPDDANISKNKIQENIRAFHPKVKVSKYKLQSCLETTKVGFIMYRTNALQVQELVKNVLNIIDRKTVVALRYWSSQKQPLKYRNK